MILVDTDIFVDYFRDYEPANAFFEKYSKDIHITYYTMMELISGAENKTQLKQIQESIFYPIQDTNNQIMQLSIKIYSKHKLTSGTGLIDSINAASAIFHNIDFYSRNSKHFKNIEKLKLKIPY